MSSLGKLSTIAFTATLLLASTAVTHAETSPAGAPVATDVATLRQLLALQYPALRHVAASPDVVAPSPSVTAEPDRGDAHTPEQGGA